MGPPVPTDMICQSYSIQCKKHRLCQSVDLKTKWNRWGQDEINRTRSFSIQCQFVFSKGAVRGTISNSKNWLEDKMGQDEINCTGSHFSYSQTLYCHDFSSCQRGFLQFKLSQPTGQSRGLLFTSAISWKPYQRILPCSFHVFNSPFKLYFAICAQLQKLTLQKYVSHVSVIWPLPGPSRPQDRAGWLDVHCISSQEE